MYQHIIDNFWYKKRLQYITYGITRIDEIPEPNQELRILFQVQDIKIVLFQNSENKNIFYTKLYVYDKSILLLQFKDMFAVEQWAIYIGMRIYTLLYIYRDEHAIDILTDFRKEYTY